MMLNLVRACAPWLSWKTAAVAGLVAVGLALCLGMPGLGLLAGAAPVLLIIACLIPCLIPLALLRRASRNRAAATQATIPLTEQPGQAAATCGCGKDSCGVGDGPSACQSEAVAR
jgi:hypothetical protein